jgi:hypothetical protein
MSSQPTKPEFQATSAGCLNPADATALVFSCTGVGPVDPAETLGNLFPSAIQRQGFCGCVFKKATDAGVQVNPGDIPCTETTAISEVIDSISC